MDQRGNWENAVINRKGFVYTVKRVVTKTRRFLFWHVELVHYAVTRVDTKTKQESTSVFGVVTDELHQVIEDPTILEVVDHFDSQWELRDVLAEALESVSAA